MIYVGIFNEFVSAKDFRLIFYMYDFVSNSVVFHYYVSHIFADFSLFYDLCQLFCQYYVFYVCPIYVYVYINQYGI